MVNLPALLAMGASNPNPAPEFAGSGVNMNGLLSLPIIMNPEIGNAGGRGVTGTRTRPTKPAPNPFMFQDGQAPVEQPGARNVLGGNFKPGIDTQTVAMPQHMIYNEATNDYKMSPPLSGVAMFSHPAWLDEAAQDNTAQDSLKNIVQRSMLARADSMLNNPERNPYEDEVPNVVSNYSQPQQPQDPVKFLGWLGKEGFNAFHPPAGAAATPPPIEGTLSLTQTDENGNISTVTKKDEDIPTILETQKKILYDPKAGLKGDVDDNAIAREKKKAQDSINSVGSQLGTKPFVGDVMSSLWNKYGGTNSGIRASDGNTYSSPNEMPAKDKQAMMNDLQAKIDAAQKVYHDYPRGYDKRTGAKNSDVYFGLRGLRYYWFDK